MKQRFSLPGMMQEHLRRGGKIGKFSGLRFSLNSTISSTAVPPAIPIRENASATPTGPGFSPLQSTVSLTRFRSGARPAASGAATAGGGVFCLFCEIIIKQLRNNFQKRFGVDMIIIVHRNPIQQSKQWCFL